MRKLYKRLFSLLAALALICTLGASAAAVNLVPAQPGTSPNYVCTWQTQETFANVRDTLCDVNLFGENGWVNTTALFPEDIRADAIFLLDDGWDLPSTSNPDWEDYFSSFLLDEEKFPGYGESPRERLKALADRICNLYFNAALGMTSGVMRSQHDGPYGNAFQQSRPLRHCMEEIGRLLRWQHIAPAFRADAYPVLVSEEILEDAHYLSGTWYGPANDKIVTQRATAAIRRVAARRGNLPQFAESCGLAGGRHVAGRLAETHLLLCAVLPAVAGGGRWCVVLNRCYCNFPLTFSPQGIRNKPA